MLSFEQFFSDCVGSWVTERTYHSVLDAEVERSHTEFQVNALTSVDKQKMIAGVAAAGGTSHGIAFSPQLLASIVTLNDNPTDLPCPGFSIAFDTTSEKGEVVAMTLNALFIPDAYFSTESGGPAVSLPLASHVVPHDDTIQGIYLRDRGYFDSSAIAGWFTYQPTRQTLEMTTHYARSIAVDQMRFITPAMRLRTIVTYQRPEDEHPPRTITLIGFGVEHKSEDAQLQPSDTMTWAQS